MGLLQEQHNNISNWDLLRSEKTIKKNQIKSDLSKMSL